MTSGSYQYLFNLSVQEDDLLGFYVGIQNPNANVKFTTLDLFLGDEYGDKARPFQLALEKAFSDVISEAIYKKLIKDFLSKKLDQNNPPEIFGELLGNNSEFLINAKANLAKNKKPNNKTINAVYEHLKNSGALKDVSYFYNEEEYQKYVETIKPYRKGFIKDREDGNISWVLGWDKIEKTLNEKIIELEKEINHPRFSLFNKITNADAEKSIQAYIRKNGVDSYNKLNQEYNDLFIAYSRCSYLSEKIEKFRAGNAKFDKKDFDIFTRYILDGNSEMVSLDRFSDESKARILEKLKEADSNASLPNTIAIEYPSIEPPINPFIKKFNEWAKEFRLCIKSSGAKSFASALRKASQVRFAGDASKLGDFGRITIDIDNYESFYEISQICYSNKIINNNNYYAENWMCEDSLFLSAKLSIPIEVEGVQRICEVKFVEKNQLKNKDLCDELYHIRRRMKPEISSGNRQYISVSLNPKETTAIIEEIEKIVAKDIRYKEFLGLHDKSFYISGENAQANFEALEKKLTKLEQLIQISDVLAKDCNPKYRNFANQIRREKIEKLSQKDGYQGLTTQEFDDIISQTANPIVTIAAVIPNGVKQHYLN